VGLLSKRAYNRERSASKRTLVVLTKIRFAFTGFKQASLNSYQYIYICLKKGLFPGAVGGIIRRIFLWHKYTGL